MSTDRRIIAGGTVALDREPRNHRHRRGGHPPLEQDMRNETVGGALIAAISPFSGP
jgi:hypothetical protein